MPGQLSVVLKSGFLCTGGSSPLDSACAYCTETFGSKFHSNQLLAVPKVGEVTEVELEVTVEGWRAADLESNGEFSGSRQVS